MDDTDAPPAAATVNNGVNVDAELSSPLQASGVLEPVPTPAVNPAVAKAVDDVLYSDIGVNTLLARLKQSIASARDLSLFFKARSEIEQRQSEKLREVSKKTSESVQRPESRAGSYAQQMKEVLRLHDRMAENSLQFSLNLYQMHTDLNQHADEIDRQRKHWKQIGFNAEKQASDAEAALEKARGKYIVLAEKYDRARTGDSSAGRHFGLRGPKSAEQREEDLHRQVKVADEDYQAKVQHTQQLRQELLSTQRPETVNALRQLIQECDAAAAMQLQKLGKCQSYVCLYLTNTYKLLSKSSFSFVMAFSLLLHPMQPIPRRVYETRWPKLTTIWICAITSYHSRVKSQQSRQKLSTSRIRYFYPHLMSKFALLTTIRL
jgi:hypothetical protein